MLHEPVEAVRARAERLAELVGGEVEETVARVGGGALPLAELPSVRVRGRGGARRAAAAGRASRDRRRPRRPHAPRLPHADRRGGRRGCRGGSRRSQLTMPLTVGTAGHIDHGKTWLVRALTGKDTDRLPEEQRRGISIDLGYAPLELPDGRRLSVVDVPGHERFVRTMVAGATGIDLFLLVDRRGRRRASADARAPCDPPTARDRQRRRRAHEGRRGRRRPGGARRRGGTRARPRRRGRARQCADGRGARRASRRARACRRTPSSRRARDRPTRLYVDRSFSVPGFGTVVTGTLWSGTIGAGDQLRLEPRGHDVRVRSVQVHDRDVERAEPGQRVAVSLPGVERDEVSRGEALVAPGGYPTSYRLDVALEELAPIEDGARVQVHLGTMHSAARVVRLGERFAQLRLASPVVAARGDRVILRGETTLGGGTVVDPGPPRHRDEARVALLARGDIASTIARTGQDRVAALRHRRRARRRRASGSVGVLGGVARGLRRTSCARGSRPPTRSTRAFRFPPSRGPTTCFRACPFERRGSKLYLPGAVATLEGREAEAGRARGGARVGRCSRDEGRRRRAGAVPRGARPARAAR